MREEIRGADQLFRHVIMRGVILVFLGDAKGTPDRFDGFRARTLIQCNTDLGAAHRAQVDALIHGGFHHRRLQGTHVNCDCVEEDGRLRVKAVLAQGLSQARGLAMDTLRDGFEAFGTMKYCVEARHNGKQGLRGTNVRCRFFAADMLLAGLQAEAVGPVAMAVDGDADNAPRHVARIALFCRHIGRVRATIADGHAEPLRGADSNIRPHRARFFKQSQCHRVCGDDANGFGVVELGDVIREVTQVTMGAWILKNCAKDRLRIHVIWIADGDFNSKRCCTGFHHSDVLGMATLVNEETLHFGFGHTLRHRHRFCASSSFVEKRGVGNL